MSSSRGSSDIEIELASHVSTLAGGFFTTSATWQSSWQVPICSWQLQCTSVHKCESQNKQWMKGGEWETHPLLYRSNSEIPPGRLVKPPPNSAEDPWSSLILHFRKTYLFIWAPKSLDFFLSTILFGYIWISCLKVCPSRKLTSVCILVPQNSYRYFVIRYKWMRIE